MAKLTPNQQEFEKQIKRIKRIMRQAEKEGITFMRSPLPERPKRITKQRLELISRIKKQTVQEYPSFATVNPEADITKLVKKHKKIETRTPRKHGMSDNDYIRKGRKGRKKGTKNKNPLSEERKQKLREQLNKARKKPRQKKPPTEKQKEAWKKNLEKAREKQAFLRAVKEDKPFEPDEQFRQQEVVEPEKQTKEKQKRKPRTTLPPEDEPFEPEPQAPEEYPEYPYEDDVVIYNVLSLLETAEYEWSEMGQVIVDFAYEIIEGAGEHDVVSRLKEASDDMMNRALNLMHFGFYYSEEAYQEALGLLEIIAGEQGVPSSYVQKLIEIKNSHNNYKTTNFWLDDYGIRG